MEDYFCLVKNVQSARMHIEYLRKKYPSDDITISFTEEEDYDIYTATPIVDYGKRYKISVVPSVMFRSEEDIQIIVFNPDMGSLTSNLLEEMKTERAYRIINILYNLSDKFSIHISPRQILEKIGRSELTDIYLADNNTVMDLIVDSGYCTNINEAYINFFSRVDLPRLLLPFDVLIRNLSHEKELYVVNPTYFISTGKKYNHIDGFVINYKRMNNKIKDVCLKNGLDIRYGSGEFVNL